MRHVVLSAVLTLAVAGLTAASAARPVSDPLLEGLAGVGVEPADSGEADVPEPSEATDDGSAVRLVLRGGYGQESGATSDDDVHYVATAELDVPLSDEFDASLRAFGLFSQIHDTESYTYYSYRYTRHGALRRKHTETYVDYDRLHAIGGAACIVWRPLRGGSFEPFVGAGAGGADIRADHEDEDESSDRKIGFALRAGVAFRPHNAVVLTAEGAFQEKVTELVADAAFRVSEGTWLHAFYESFDFDASDGSVLGGGISFVF